MPTQSPVFSRLRVAGSSVSLILTIAIVAAGILLTAAPVESAVAAGGQVMGQVQLPTFNFDPTKWVQDAFGALLQTFSDGIRAGLDALWAANFITQTPPSLSYRTRTFVVCTARCSASPTRRLH